MAVDHVESPPGAPELLDVDLPGATYLVTSGPVDRRDRLTMIALGAVIVAVLVLMAGFGSGDSSDRNADDRRSPAPVEEPAPPTTDAVSGDDEVINDPFTNSRSTLTFPPALPRRATAAEDGQPTTYEPGSLDLEAEPLGRSTGLWLFIGGDNPLQRFDLDTGTHELYGVRALPLFATSTELVIASWASGLVAWVSQEDPWDQPDGWIDGSVAPVDGRNEIWARRREEGERWDRFDLETNRIVERRAVPVQALEAPAGVVPSTKVVSGPDVIDTAEGVFQFDEDEYWAVWPGRSVARGQSVMLLERCGNPLSECVRRWVDTETWAVIDRPPPPDNVVGGDVIGGGRWLRAVNAEGGAELIDTTTGESVFRASSPYRLAASADGEIVARMPEDGSVEVLDVTTDTVLSIDGVFQAGPGGLALVPKEPSTEDR